LTTLLILRAKSVNLKIENASKAGIKIGGSPPKRAWRASKKKRGSGGNEFLPAPRRLGVGNAGRVNRQNPLDFAQRKF